MNASRRICCHAANAFRPGHALKNVFAVSIDRRHASTANSIRPDKGQDRGGAVHDNVHRQGDRRAAYRRLGQHAEDLAAVLEGDLGHEIHPVEEVGTPKEHAEEPDEPDVTYKSVRHGLGGADRDVLGELHSRTHGRPRSPPDADILDFTSPKLAEIQRKKLAGQEQDVLEYEGLYVKPTATQGRDYQAWRQPWTKGLHLGDKSKSIHERLGSEIVAFAKWLRHTKAELATRESVIEQTMSIVKNAGTKFEIEPFGSSRTRLGLASSDVDLRLFKAWEEENDQATWLPKDAIPLPPKWKTRKQSLAALHVLQKKFMEHPSYILCNIRFARYPLLHMQHAPSGTDVQIVCANDTSAQREWIERQLEKRPYIADLYAVIKTMLDTRGLTDVFRGGLGSYAIFSMIMVVLNKMDYDKQQKARRRGPNVDEVSNLSDHERLGQDLERVLLFWSHFDTYRKAVTVKPVGIFPKSDPDSHDELKAVNGPLRILDKSQPYLLCLEDPNDPTNDLGRQAYGWKHIQATIKYLSKGLMANLAPGNPIEIKSFLKYAVGTADVDYCARRILAEAYGKAAMEAPNGIPRPGSYKQPRRHQGSKSGFRRLTLQQSLQDVGKEHRDTGENGADSATSEITESINPIEEVSSAPEDTEQTISDVSDTHEKAAATA